MRTSLVSRTHSFKHALPQQRTRWEAQRAARLLRSQLAANVSLDRSSDVKRGSKTVASCELRFLSDRALVPAARRAASRYACALSAFDADALYDIELAVGEALANAVEHGHRDGSYISVTCESRDDAFQVTVRDGGMGFDPVDYLLAGPCSDRGYGIGIMRSAMDSVEFLSGGTAVTMLKRYIATPGATA
ncbi:MAG: ATP-binding protein [Candidatus Eremiobacteraeota bacterium]|nr:ATP-binding protein [Candidatus Eremiobacteraeota bacterium]